MKQLIPPPQKKNDAISLTYLQILNKLFPSPIMMKTQGHGSCEKIKLRSEINSAVCSILRLNATQQFYLKDS